MDRRKLGGLNPEDEGPWIYMGTGADGVINGTFTPSKYEYQFTNFTLAAGQTLTVPSDYKPLIIRATQKITIAGTLIADYAGFTGANAPYGKSQNGIAGNGPGGGLGGGYVGFETDYAAGGGGGSFGGVGQAGSGRGGAAAGQPGAIYPNIYGALLGGSPQGFIAGSGGASGSCGWGNSADSQNSPGDGGNGGGAVCLIAPEIEFQATALCYLRGANGQAGQGGPGAGGGGAGSGGALIAVARYISLPPAGTLIVATGGTGADGRSWDTMRSDMRGGNGGPGLVAFIYLNNITADAINRSNPQATIKKITGQTRLC